MNPFTKMYRKGINLGGWLSQYGHNKNIGDPHFHTFITIKDIAHIANIGFDHIRLPVDYMIFESDDDPGVYNENGLQHIDLCLEWCAQYNLNLILDLHYAPGFSFNAHETNCLFSDSNMQKRFIDIWRYFTKRYLHEGKNVSFELLNEVVEPTPGSWNTLAKRTVEQIRKMDKNRTIIIGSNDYNCVTDLKDLSIIQNDDNIVYNFHFYEPMIFTHQGASWSKIPTAYGIPTSYPSIFPGIAAFLDKHPEFTYCKQYIDRYIDIEHLRHHLQPAVDFIKETGKTLYCGEYGVIQNADPKSRSHWLKDCNQLLDEYGIGRAVWTYKAMHFGLMDNHNTIDSSLLQF